MNRLAALAGTKILVVDDSTIDQCKLRELLVREGYRVSSAYDGHQGYEMANVTHPGLILLEVRMHAMDGFATCRLLKANAGTEVIPVIFISGDDQPETRILGLKLGAVDFIGKPFSTGELIARIEIHLRLAGRADAAPVANTVAATGADSDSVLVAAVQRLVDEHLGEPLNLDDIASQVGSYREKISRIFLEQLGVTVFAHIRERRILRSAELLRESDAGIAEIAYEIGFCNAGNFATAFRGRMGVTPGTYRRSARTGKSK